MNHRTQRQAALALEILALIFLAAVISNWLTGGYQLKLGPLKVSVKSWEKPFALWLAMLALWTIASPGPSRAIALIRAALGRVGDFLGTRLPRPWSGWAAWGAAAGAAVGYAIARNYFPFAYPAYGFLAPVLAGALAGGTAHGLYHLLSRPLFGWMGKKISPGKPEAVRQALYLACLAGLAYFPLRAWEPRLTEPVFTQLLTGLLIGLAVVWAVFLDDQRQGAWVRVRRAAKAGAGLAVILAAWGLVQGNVSGKHQAAHRVLLITIDTVRADRLSCYGHPKPTTPNLDRLAHGGVIFKRAFCPFGTTEPSHASLLTGVYPRTHGVVRYHQKVTGQVSSLAEFFADKGWLTAAVTSRQRLLPDDMGIGGFHIQSGPHEWAVQSSADDAFRRAAYIIAQNPDRDLFLWVHFFDPHKPYVFHPGFSEPFVEKDRGPRDPDGFLKPDQNYSPREIAYINQLYDGEIAYMDHYIGRLLDLARPTLAAVIADHGEILGELHDTPLHYGFGHGGLIATPVIRVPFIMAGEKIRRGLVVEDIVETIDLPTTLIAILFGESFPGQGMDLLPVMGGGPSDNLAVATRYIIDDDEGRPWLKLPQHALFSGASKASIIGPRGRETFELYDWIEDGLDGKNRAGEDPAGMERMKKEWEAWQARTPETKPEARELSPTEIQNLKALGYIQ